MNRREIAEIRKRFSPASCSIDRICGCYVDGDKNKRAVFKQPFLTLPEEDMFKYFDIFRKSMSEGLGKNLLSLEFPVQSEMENGSQSFLLKLRDSELKDDDLLDEYYDKIIESYEYVGNYVILVIHDSYDVPKKTTDNQIVEDGSDEVYSYILTCICPVELSKPGLSYDDKESIFKNRFRDRVISPTDIGFLFPAFTDRSTDIHGCLYYSKSIEDLRETFVKEVLGCVLPLSVASQKAAFKCAIEDALGSNCTVKTMRSVHEVLTTLVEENKEKGVPLLLTSEDLEKVVQQCVDSTDQIQNFNYCYDTNVGEGRTLVAENIIDVKTLSIKTPELEIKIDTDHSELLDVRKIGNDHCLVIPLHGEVTIDGVVVNLSDLEK